MLSLDLLSLEVNNSILSYMIIFADFIGYDI